MKILYLSMPVLADSMFPLYKAMLDKNVDATYVMATNNLQSPLFDIRKKSNKRGLVPASEYPELMFYENYADMNRVFVLNNQFGKRTPISSLHCILALIHFIKKNKFDVIHIDFALFGWFRFLYIFKERIVCTQHDPFTHSGTQRSKEVAKRLERSHRKIKKFVILNKSQYQDFCQQNNLKTNQVLVNQLGKMDYVELMRSKDVRPVENKLIFWGRISKYKGIEYLSEAMKIVHETIPGATLDILGGGNLYFDFTPYSNLPYIKLVNKFMDYDELFKLIDESSLAVFPYTDSTQSGCILMAYSLGVPVITTDINTMREIVDEGKSALIVPTKDAQALAKAIIAYLSNKEMQTNMRNYITNQYFEGERSWAAIADKYLVFYAK